MTHPEQQAINQHIEWLLQSKPGQNAMIPCTQYDWADWLFRGTAGALVQQFDKPQWLEIHIGYRKISIIGLGTLRFIVPRLGNLRGIEWDHIFEVTGPRMNWQQREEMEQELRFARLSTGGNQ